MKVEVEVKVPLDGSLKDELKRLGVEPGRVEIRRKSIDARGKPIFIYRVLVDLPDAAAEKLLSEGRARKVSEESFTVPVSRSRKRVLVVGAGPAGLFSSYILSKSGLEVHLIERGRRVDERVEDVKRFWSERLLDENSNVQFGEGGAGTFSDGKLITRSKDRKKTFVYRILVEHGAPEEILYDSKPHIGTDRLRKVIPNLRLSLEESGVIFSFSTKLNSFIASKGRVFGAVIEDVKSGRVEERFYDYVLLAVGNSSRDTFSMLVNSGFSIAAKPFAVGLRIVHPQLEIDRMQYGKFYSHPKLPPADYSVTFRGKERSVFSFCMCPGGYVICSSSEREGVVTNGMSNYRRDGEFANSAIVVQVFPEDFGNDPLRAVEFQRTLERRAFNEGGRNYSMPAQMVLDFLKGRESDRLLSGGFIPSVSPSRLDLLLPEFISSEIGRALKHWGKRMKPFVSSNAMLIGVETRTSSPVRILRDELFRAKGFENVFPCGEGSGYSGGITSSAVDGINAALSLVSIVNAL